jgi:catechol 2,3-dioxygenase-like lactoylglutathione lyase family enzyme
VRVAARLRTTPYAEAMFEHVAIRTDDLPASERFFTSVLAPLEIERTYSGDTLLIWHDFVLSAAGDGRAPTTGAHVAFAAPSREHVEGFWRAGVDAGYQSDGAPGPRPQYGEDYYGAFVLDPAGNSVEAVHRSGMRERPAVIDHVAIRVADLTAATGFYGIVAETLGFDTRHPGAGRATLVGRDSGGLLSLVENPAAPTASLHIAFAGDDDAVRRFHEDAVAAGYRSNGEPGERPQYHPGYYAAFVFDPDGNNIEVVDQHR